MERIAIKYMGESLYIEERGRYRDGTPVIQIHCDDGEPCAILTVCMMGTHEGLYGDLPPNHYIVKTWSENASIAKYLLEKNIFEDTGLRIDNGYVEAEIWKLTER